MKQRNRPSAALVAGCAFAALVLFCLGYSAWKSDQCRRFLSDEQRQANDLDGKLAAVRRAHAAKRAVAAEVIAGRLTLFEAAAHFRDLDAQHPEFNWDTFRRSFPGTSDEERFCRAVLLRVAALLPEGPGPSEPVLFGLEADLQAHLAQHGTALLPPR